MSSDKQPSSSKADNAPAITDAELEKLLAREASALNRELEVERILKAFKLKCVLQFTSNFLNTRMADR